MLSKSCEYAIRATIYLYNTSSRQESKISIDEIAKKIDAPRHFTAKILQILSKQHIISSIKGPNGGFYMNSIQGKLRLLEIVNAIDGKHLIEGCFLGLEHCNENHPCPIHEDYKPIRKKLLKMLQSTTIESLSDRINDDLSFLVALN